MKQTWRWFGPVDPVALAHGSVEVQESAISGISGLNRDARFTDETYFLKGTRSRSQDMVEFATSEAETWGSVHNAPRLPTLPGRHKGKGPWISA